MTHLKTDRSSRTVLLVGGFLVGPVVIIGQRSRPAVEHEPSFQPLATAATARVPAPRAGQLFQVTAARRAVNPKVSAGGSLVVPVVQLMSGRLYVCAQVERRLAASGAIVFVPHGQVPGQRSLWRDAQKSFLNV